MLDSEGKLMTEPKYALYPGDVRSSKDGDFHFINAHQLAHLYMVPMSECLVVRRDDICDPQREDLVRRASTLIKCSPRNDGKYPIFGHLPADFD